MLRIGIDLGGTKIAGVSLSADGTFSDEIRTPTPRGDYFATIAAIGAVIERLTAGAGVGHGKGRPCVGLGIPGSSAPISGTIQNANSTWLNARPLASDLETALGLPVRLANDANCFALSEAHDGAGAGKRTVFGVILGTGCGGGIVIDGRLHDGCRAIAGEWGHNPLPRPSAEECPGPACWCGRNGCLETWLSGPGLAADHARETGRELSSEEIVAAAAAGDAAARATLARHTDRLARGLASVVNLIDPDVIVLGGGLSRLSHLYRDLPAAIAPHVFAEDNRVTVHPPAWGDSSGVRGAARLWPGASTSRSPAA